MHTFLALMAIYIIFLIGMNRERGMSSAFYMACKHRLFPRKQFLMYLAYLLVLTVIGATLIPKRFGEASLVYTVVLLTLAMAPTVFYRPTMRVYYIKNEAEVFRSSQTQTQQGPYLAAVTYQTTMMPFYKDEARTQLIGKLYSSAEIYADKVESLSEVIQYTTYVFNGSDKDFPEGTIVMSLSNKNDIQDIFPPDNVYRGQILACSGAYEGQRVGHIDVNIRGDKRMAVFTF